ncbi:MAG: FkbM family methyltransferase [Candidatus Hydrogenedentota bacterium]
MRSIPIVRAILFAVALTSIFVACNQNPVPEENNQSSSPQIEAAPENPSETTVTLKQLKELARSLSTEELRALQKISPVGRVGQAEMDSWGNRFGFFSNIIPFFRPDLDWRNALSPLLKDAEPFWSQGFEEIIIRDFFQDKRNGVYVDLGCAWPDTGSTSFYLDSKLDWDGIAIDALPEYGELWAKKRPESTFVSYAVSDTSGEKVTFYRNDWTGVSSLIKKQSAKRGGEEKLMEIEVETITLDDLLPMHGITKIDHLTIDIEGAEMGALRGFDIERFLPELVCVETLKIEEVRAYFNAHGYELIEKYRKADKINIYFSRKKQD